MKKEKMAKLLYSLDFFMWLSILVTILLAFASFSRDKVDGNDLLPYMLLGCVLSFLCPIIKSMNKRIEELEKINESLREE